MGAENDGVDLSAELEAIFSEEEEQETPPAGSNGETGKQEEPQVDQTQAFAKRLKERTDKAVAEERERLAKEFGYSSYEDYQKNREAKLIKDKGLDPDDVSPVVEEIVKQRLNNDPRMKELESYRAKQAEEFAKKELDTLKELTGGEIGSMDQVPKDVIEDWKTSGSLKSSYLKLHGEELITKTRAAAAKGTTQHLVNPSGAPPTPQTERPLTDEEKRIWKFFNPNMTDEELNKKTTKI